MTRTKKISSIFFAEGTGTGKLQIQKISEGLTVPAILKMNLSTHRLELEEFLGV